MGFGLGLFRSGSLLRIISLSSLLSSSAMVGREGVVVVVAVVNRQWRG